MSNKRTEKSNAMSQLVPMSNFCNVGLPIDGKFFNTPNRMADKDWLPQWQLRDAARELLANMIDQARTVAEEIFVGAAFELEFSEEPGRFAVHVGTNLLAEAKWGRKKLKFTKSHHNAGTVKARAEAGASAKEDAQFLELTNYSSSLPFTSFYVGHSTKRNNLRAIGKHGEGLTGACVVLNRHGCNVIADCTNKGYQAEIVRLGNDVFFRLQKKKGSGLPSGIVRFTIIFDPSKPAEDLQEMMSSVRLSSASIAAGIATSHGTLLMEPALRGKQFNRSIFVGEGENCLFGYDFLDPEKTLLQGRDRNSHSKNGFVIVCASIISEAILQSEAVREEVLKCFLYAPGYDANGPREAAPKRFSDLKDGLGLTPAAVDALRRHCEQVRALARKGAMFIATDTPELKEIRRLLGLAPVYGLPVLHNHATIVRDFKAMLARDAQELDQTTRVGALKEQLQELLNVRELKQASNASAKIGMWVVDGVGYVTAAHSLGAAATVGLTRLQQRSIFDSLQSAKVNTDTILEILDLVRKQPVPELLPEPVDQAMETDVALETRKNQALLSGGAVADDSAETAGLEEKGVQMRPLTFVLALPQPPRGTPDCSAAGDDAAYVAGDAVGRSDADNVLAEPAEEFGKSCEPARKRTLVAAGADRNDVSIVDPRHADVPRSSEATDEENDKRCAEDLPTPKRQRLNPVGPDAAARSSAGPSVEVIDLSLDTSSDVSSVSSAESAVHREYPQLLRYLPQEISLSNVHYSIVRQRRFHEACGVWLYTDNATSERTVREKLTECIPTAGYRAKLRNLSALCHIIVFVTADKRAPMAFNHGPHLCINLGACKDEQQLKYFANAQLKALNLLE